NFAPWLSYKVWVNSPCKLVIASNNLRNCSASPLLACTPNPSANNPRHKHTREINFIEFSKRKKADWKIFWNWPYDIQPRDAAEVGTEARSGLRLLKPSRQGRREGATGKYLCVFRSLNPDRAAPHYEAQKMHPKPIDAPLRPHDSHYVPPTTPPPPPPSYRSTAPPGYSQSATYAAPPKSTPCATQSQTAPPRHK